MKFDRYTTWATRDGSVVSTVSADETLVLGDDPDDPSIPLLSWYGYTDDIKHMRAMHEWASEQVEEILK